MFYRIFWFGFCCLVIFASTLIMIPTITKSAEPTINGEKLICKNTTVATDNNIPSEGLNLGNGRHNFILLNMRMMRSYSVVLKKFIFYHECAHSHIGESELLADCWAINEGVKGNWLKKENLPEICASWEGAPETETHPSAVRRCNNIYKCFGNLIKRQNKNVSSTSSNNQ